jgi:hypothetical protein
MRERAAIGLALCTAIAACGGGGGGVKHNLSLTATGPGGVTSAPAGITCRLATCQAAFDAGASVTLTAHPDAGTSFAGWGGACTGFAITCTVTLGADVQVSAGFNGATAGNFSLTVTVTGSGVVTSSPPGINCPTQCTASFSSTGPVLLTPTAQGGASFSGWTGACTGSGGCTVTLGQDQSTAATFSTPAGTHLLTVAVGGSGSVTSTPAGINCPMGACASSFAAGTQVMLSSTPDTGQTFSGWTGACSGVAGCSVTLDADSSVNATFAGPGY